MDAIRMMGIVKCFGPVRANDGIDLIVKQQEIHCLLGENGTGKVPDEHPVRPLSPGCRRDLY